MATTPRSKLIRTDAAGLTASARAHTLRPMSVGGHLAPVSGVGEDVRLTILRPHDEAALVELFAANDVPEVTRFFDPFPLTREVASQLVRYQGRDRYWGVWVDRTLAGLAMVRGRDDRDAEATLGLLLDRRFRGQGVAVLAIELLCDELQSLGEPLVRARIHEHNLSSARVLAKAGTWTVVSRGEGRVVMERRLSPPPS